MSYGQHLGDIDITFMVTCFNESKTIAATLDSLIAALEEFSLRWEILVINDNSADDSVEVVQHYQTANPDLPIRLFSNQTNQGFGYNYVHGAFLGRGEFYRVLCGDNCEPKETLVEIIKHMFKSDIVIPFYLRDDRSLARRLVSRSYTRLINLISGHDIRYYNGLILTRRENVLRWHGNYQGFGIQADLLTRLLDEGHSYVEVPVTDNHDPNTKAFTLTNFLSVTHTLLDLSIRRVGSLIYSRDQSKGESPTVALPHPGGEQPWVTDATYSHPWHDSQHHKLELTDA